MKVILVPRRLNFPRVHPSVHQFRRSRLSHLRLRKAQPPKGALDAHRSLFGHLPGFVCHYEFAQFAQEGRTDLSVLPGTSSTDCPDIIWTPADWAWIGGLMDVLIPAWYYGMTVLTSDRDFEPE